MLSVPSSGLHLAPASGNGLGLSCWLFCLVGGLSSLYKKRRFHAQHARCHAQAWQPAGRLWIPRTGPNPAVVRPEHAHRERRGGWGHRSYTAKDDHDDSGQRRVLHHGLMHTGDSNVKTMKTDGESSLKTNLAASLSWCQAPKSVFTSGEKNHAQGFGPQQEMWWGEARVWELELGSCHAVREVRKHTQEDKAAYLRDACPAKEVQVHAEELGSFLFL